MPVAVRSSVVSARRSTTQAPTWACFLEADPLQIPIDPNGNLTSKTEGSDTWGCEWNARNELTRVTKNSIEQARFGYDPSGRRVEKVAVGVTTAYTYDGSDILREIRGSATLRYVHGPGIDAPLAADDGTAVTYFHADGLGSIVGITDGSGAVTLTRRYDAWGSLEVSVSDPGYAFTGREWDPEVGLYYYRARFYDARNGRFISEDPLGLFTDVNAYWYVKGRPVLLTDPLGLQASCRPPTCEVLCIPATFGFKGLYFCADKPLGCCPNARGAFYWTEGTGILPIKLPCSFFDDSWKNPLPPLRGTSTEPT